MRRQLFTLGLAALTLAACGSSTTSSSSSTSRPPLPAGPTPSKISAMVCSHEANKKFNTVLGESGVVTSVHWDVSNHTYSCTFEYPSGGAMTLSVKELSSWQETKAYFNQQKTAQGNAGSIGNLGQGAFRTNDGSILVRKDWKVLDVNITGLPSQFGVPPTSSDAVAYTVADLVLGCWNGD